MQMLKILFKPNKNLNLNNVNVWKSATYFEKILWLINKFLYFNNKITKHLIK